MKDLETFLQSIRRLDAAGASYAVATVVKVSGSTYRGAGARMIVTEEGGMIGAISGGCVETDVYEQAQSVMASGTPQIITYDTTSEDDIVWGMGLGCSGIVEALMERRPEPTGLAYTEFLADCFDHHKVGVLATVFRETGAVDTSVGDRLIVRDDGSAADTIADDRLRELVLSDAANEMAQLQATTVGTAQGRSQRYNLARGSAEVLIEPVLPPLPLVVFGGGHDAVPVVRIARELGWSVSVVDHRPAFAVDDRFPGARVLLEDDPELAAEKLAMDRRTALLIMTHNYLKDLAVIRRALETPVRYVGILGPKRRAQRLLADFAKENGIPADDLRARIYSPVGLDIGAETSKEIALSILAEIQSVFAGRTGGPLRSRGRPIHDRPAAMSLDGGDVQ